MVEVISKTKSIERIEDDRSRYKPSAKSLRGLLIGMINRFKNDAEKGKTYTPMELQMIFEEIYGKYAKLDTRAMANIEGWKGKSSIQVIEKPESIDIVRYRRKDKDSEPMRVVSNIPKDEINKMILAINRANRDNKEGIPTREIAKWYFIISEMKINNHGKPLFENGEFVWDNFFSDRYLHPFLVDVLDLLDYYGVIHYSGGHSKILKKVASIQTVLSFSIRSRER